MNTRNALECGTIVTTSGPTKTAPGMVVEDHPGASSPHHLRKQEA